MKSAALPTIFALALIACDKKQMQPPARYYVTTTTDTISYIALSSLNLTKHYNTTADAGNRIKDYLFTRLANPADSLTADQVMGSYYATPSYNSYVFKIRYVGIQALLDTANIVSRENSSITYKLSDLLKGKPLFEVYYADSNIVAKRLIASDKMVWIRVAYNSDDSTAASTITAAFQHFLLPAVTTQFTYGTFFHRR